ncbi:glycoside hydrolase family protein [Campylobacter gracilis]|uniref:Lysozyme n=1 Tax=Campylobacter gracilis RM3268 TaxID=553220 RepID=C8PIK2_9BACT|nr:glycoside hydrolase family protein [Campylobacter gracilis]AKT92067.1 phage lysozyme, putative [Campylobacter gracilis]EEV17367.1 phage lysozyme [Campylobacter gracilis RM3268]UEB45736.1 glycoside hydrolase family protein [Campylobacter gracilis]SUW81584.1 Phage-related lysozyme (muraminidase) [Campylobacter gracilis]
MSLIANIKENEGFCGEIYEDTRGYKTIGYGFLVAALSKNELALNGGKVEPMSREAADQILELKLKKLKPRVFEAFAWLQDKPQNVQDVVIEMCYQMGVVKVQKFVTTLHHIRMGEYEKAITNGLRSLWAQQTPNRAKKVLNGLLAKH